MSQASLRNKDIGLAATTILVVSSSSLRRGHANLSSLSYSNFDIYLLTASLLYFVVYINDDQAGQLGQEQIFKDSQSQMLRSGARL